MPRVSRRRKQREMVAVEDRERERERRKGGGRKGRLRDVGAWCGPWFSNSNSKEREREGKEQMARRPTPKPALWSLLLLLGNEAHAIMPQTSAQ